MSTATEDMALAILRATGQGGIAETCLAVLDQQTAGERCVAVVRTGSWLDRSLLSVMTHDRLFRLAADEVDDAACFRSPQLTVRAQHATAPDLVAADRDRDLPAPPRIGWPGRRRGPPRRLRRLDTLCAGGPPIGLLVIEAANAIEILHGATGLLRAGATTLVVDLVAAAPAARPAFWESVVSGAGPGFAWHDGFLLPRADPAARRHAVLLHAATSACGLPVGSSVAPRPPAGIAAMLAPDEQVTAGIAWRGWDGPLGRPSADPAMTVDFDAALPCDGFYPAETDGSGRWWRWSGPDARASFALPVRAPGRYRLRLDVVDWGTVEQPAALTVAIDGARLRPETGDSRFVCFAPVAIVPGTAYGRARVDIMTPPPRRASTGDPRRIGINLTRAVLAPVATRSD